MNLSSLRLVLVIAMMYLATSATAQERTAGQPFNGSGDVTSPALVQKISYLTQLNHTLQASLSACQSGQPVSVTAENPIEDNGDFAPKPVASGPQKNGEDSLPQGFNSRVSMNYAPPAPRRTGGVIQQASEPKLGCDDYSLSYFRRHPAMAAVCGKVDEIEQKSAPVTITSPSGLSWVSVTSNVSSSAAWRARILGISPTSPIGSTSPTVR